MDVIEAAYRVAHDYRPNGAVGIAPRIGKSAGTLLNELNPHQESHKLGLLTATAMQAASGDHRILHAMAHTLGEVCFPVPDLSNVSDAALLEMLAKIGQEGGDFYRELNIALEDKRFSREDFATVKREAMEFIAAIAQAIARIEGMVDA